MVFFFLARKNPSYKRHKEREKKSNQRLPVETCVYVTNERIHFNLDKRRGVRFTCSLLAIINNSLVRRAVSAIIRTARVVVLASCIDCERTKIPIHNREAAVTGDENGYHM